MGKKYTKKKQSNTQTGLWEMKTSVFCVPWVVSMVIAYILVRGISATHPRYGTRCVLFAALVVMVWTVVFIWHQRGIIKNRITTLRIDVSPVFVVIIALFIGTFLAYLAWSSGYHTLLPYEQIDNGAQHIDTMFHSAIAESWRRAGYPSTLLNDERYLPYHTFSHLILGAIAGIMNMPSFIAYNFVYPVLFLPMHCMAAFYAVASAKYFFEGDSHIRFLDMIIIGLYIFGVTDNIGTYGIGKTPFFISESFLTANTISFLCYGLTFYIFKKYEKNNRALTIYCAICVPLEILIIAWSKISVGFLFTAGAMYLAFRWGGIKRFKPWLLDILYFAVFIVGLKLFNSDARGLSKSFSSMIEWFPLREQIGVGRLGMWGHYLILSLMTLFFIGLEINRNRFKWRDIKAGKTIWVECIVVMSILAFLPSAILNFGYSNAVYFSFPIEIPALVLLCGHDYIDIEAESKGSLKAVIYVVCFSWCIWMGYHHKPANPLTLITNQHNSNLSTVLLQIREEVGKNSEDYTIYIETDSFLTQVFPEGRRAIFVCPAMTGVGVINATYFEDGGYYAYTGEGVSAYGMEMVENGRLSYEDALTVAKERGKEHVIHFTNSGYEIVDID